MNKKTVWFLLFVCGTGVYGLLVGPGAAPAGSQNVTPTPAFYRLSNPNDPNPNKGSDNPSIGQSGNTLYMAFSSEATNLVSGDSNGATDIFVATAGNWGDPISISRLTNGNRDSWDPQLATYGNNCYRVAFASAADNLVSNDTNQWADVFVYDSCANPVIRLVSVGNNGVQGNNLSHQPDIANDGSAIAFTSLANNLVNGEDNPTCDTNYDNTFEDSCPDIFVRNLTNNSTVQASLPTPQKIPQTKPNNGSWFAAISQTGRYVAFESLASNLITGDSNGVVDIFVRDLTNGTTVRVSVKSNNSQASNESTHPDIASNATQSHTCYWVVFESHASLISGVGGKHVYLRNSCTNQNELISRASDVSGGASADSVSGNPAISNDGCRVVFESWAVNLQQAAPFENAQTDRDGDIFMRERCLVSMTTNRISNHTDTNNNNAGGRQGVDDSVSPAISPDGTVVVFKSRARNMVTGDTNLATDIFAVKP